MKKYHKLLGVLCLMFGVWAFFNGDYAYMLADFVLYELFTLTLRRPARPLKRPHAPGHRPHDQSGLSLSALQEA
jgi:hypothetical protein